MTRPRAAITSSASRSIKSFTSRVRKRINAAEEYLYQQPQWKRVQFNILSITILKDEPVEYFLIEDVFL
jgi:Holliday junction resolvase-like predicted endonuclease